MIQRQYQNDQHYVKLFIRRISSGSDETIFVINVSVCTICTSKWRLPQLGDI